MYGVKVEVVLQGRDGTMGLSRRLSLPFAPFEGLGLFGLTTNPDEAETVIAVSWDVVAQQFHVELLECYCAEESLSDLLDYYGPDWELHEPGFETIPDA